MLGVNSLLISHRVVLDLNNLSKQSVINLSCGCNYFINIRAFEYRFPGSSLTHHSHQSPADAVFICNEELLTIQVN